MRKYCENSRSIGRTEMSTTGRLACQPGFCGFRLFNAPLEIETSKVLPNSTIEKLKIHPFCENCVIDPTNIISNVSHWCLSFTDSSEVYEHASLMMSFIDRYELGITTASRIMIKFNLTGECAMILDFASKEDPLKFIDLIKDRKFGFCC